ncbi:hypothetical protein PybrP1_010866 [[Pythium] brassicae (nom. inval.)]|nr:hypothetical protein PybrP1_010866 [[Pythium] brassicae (nom. inval.)]
MASSLLDELPCLLDEADELMARLAFFMKLLPGGVGATQWPKSESNAQASPRENSDDHDELARTRACLTSSETASALKFFGKQFLASQPVAVEKVLALLSVLDPNSARSETSSDSKPLQSVARKVFHLMKRVHHWQRAAWGLLTQFFAESAYLSFDKHRLLSSLLLDTLAKYVKVHLLWTSWRHAIPSLLAVHTFVQFTDSPGHRAAVQVSGAGGGASGSSSAPPDPSATTFSPLEHTDLHLREYVLCFGSNPLFKIQQDFQQHPDAGEIARNLTSLVLSCFESYVGCHDLEQLRNQGVFDTETFFLGNYAALSVYEDLLISRQQEDWVLCTALCLPHQLKATPRSGVDAGAGSSSVRLWDFVHIVAQDRLMLPVFRGFAVNVHSALYQQIACTVNTAPGAAGGSGGGIGTVGPSLSSPLSSTGGPPSLKKLMRALSKQALRTCASHHAQRAQLVSWLAQGCRRVLTQNPALAAPLFPVLLGACRFAHDEIEWLLSHEDQPQQLLLPAHAKPKHLHRVRASFTGNASVVGDLLARVHQLRSLVQQHLRVVEIYYAEFVAHGDADAIAFEIHALLEQHRETLGSDSGGAATSLASSEDRRPPQANPQQILSSFAATARYRSPTESMTWRREWRQLSVVLLASPTMALPASLTKLMERASVHAMYVESAGRLLSHHSQMSKWWWFSTVFEETFRQLLRRENGGAAGDAIAMLGIVHAAVAGSYELDEIAEALEAHDVALAVHALYHRMESAVGTQLERSIDAVVAHEVALRYHASSEHRLPAAIATMSMPLVETHVRQCLVRFLRGLVVFSSESVNSGADAPKSGAGATVGTAAPTVLVSLRCSLEQARFELQSYVRCICRLFRNADFVDLAHVVRDALASEQRVAIVHSVNEGESAIASRVPGDSEPLDANNLVQRVVRLYLFVLKHQYVVGASGMRALAASVMSCACRQVLALRIALEQDEVALIWFGKAANGGSPPDELAMAIKQMARLEEIADRLTQIGLHLFFVELLQEIDPTLLPAAFAASFHSALWRRSKYLVALDAADSNAHMSAVATQRLLQLVRKERQTALGLRAAAAAAGASAKDAQATRAMFAAVRMLAVDPAATRVHELPEAAIKLGVVDQFLPEIVLQMQ